MCIRDRYTIDPDGAAGAEPAFDAYCDQTTNGGGWMLVATRDSTTTPGAETDYGTDLTNPDPDADNMHKGDWAKLGFSSLWIQLATPRTFGTTPPNRVPGVYGDRRRGWPPHRAGSPPGIPGARLQRGWAIGAGCPCLRGPQERVFRGLRPGLRPLIQNRM